MDGIDAILIGSIGVLAHCSELQWNLFNQSLREHVLDGHIKLAQGGDINRAGIEKGQVIWEKEAYIESLVQTGGSKRLKAYFEEKGLKDISDAAIKSVHVRKNDLFTEHIVDPSKGLVLRSGIMDMLVAAKKAGVKCAFVTTTDKKVMEAFVKSLGLTDYFAYTLCEVDLPHFGNKGKPSPDCYWYAIRQLLGDDSLEAVGDGMFQCTKKVVAIEDTQISLESPVAAGLPSIAFPSEWAVKQDFSKAATCAAELTDVCANGGAALEEFAKIAVKAN